MMEKMGRVVGDEGWTTVGKEKRGLRRWAIGRGISMLDTVKGFLQTQPRNTLLSLKIIGKLEIFFMSLRIWKRLTWFIFLTREPDGERNTVSSDSLMLSTRNCWKQSWIVFF